MPVESDVDSDDEDSLSGSSNFKSECDMTVKHDKRDDHRAKHLDFEPEVEPLQSPNCPQEATEDAPAAPELRCSISGKS